MLNNKLYSQINVFFLRESLLAAVREFYHVCILTKGQVNVTKGKLQMHCIAE